MVRLLFWIFSASLLPCVVNSFMVESRSFVKRATDAEICGAANYYICSDLTTCCPNGFLCEGQGCVKEPDITSNDPTNTDVVITVTVTPSPLTKPVLGTGAIVGIAVGGAIFLIAAGIAIFFCMRKRKTGKKVLKAYEDPSRNMYDQVVVEEKQISVVPIGGATTTQQRRQTQTNLSSPSEAQEMEGAAVGLKPEEQYPQQQYQQEYQQQQVYQQQPQQREYYNQNQEQTQQGAELEAGPQAPALYIPEPIPDALRVGSPISPIRADSMGLIPVAADSADGGQHPYQFSPVIRRQSIPFTPPPHHQNTEPIPQSSSLPTMPTSPSVSLPQKTSASLSQSPVYYQPQTPSPPPRETSPQQSPERYQTPQTYPTPQAAYQQYQQGGVHRKPAPPNNYSQYHQQYQQYPEQTSSPVQSQYPMHGHDPRGHMREGEAGGA